MTYKREMTLWKIRSHSTVLLKKKHFLFTSYEEKKRHLCWWNCSCPSFMVWLFLPKWVICPQGDDVTVSFSIKEHEVKTVLYFMYCKTPCLMLLSVECLSSTSLQCSQLQCSIFSRPWETKFHYQSYTLMDPGFHSQPSIMANSQQLNGYGELTLFIFEKAPCSIKCNTKFMGARRQSQLPKCLWLTWFIPPTAARPSVPVV